MEILSNPTNTISYRRLFVNVVCYAFALVYLYAAVYKLIDYPFFLRQLKLSPLLGNFHFVLAWLVPTLEILISFGLMLAKYRHGAYVPMSMR